MGNIGNEPALGLLTAADFFFFGCNNIVTVTVI